MIQPYVHRYDFTKLVMDRYGYIVDDALERSSAKLYEVGSWMALLSGLSSAERLWVSLWICTLGLHFGY